MLYHSVALFLPPQALKLKFLWPGWCRAVRARPQTRYLPPWEENGHERESRLGEGMEIRGGEEGDQAISKLLRGWQGQQSKEQNLIYKEYTKTKALDGVLAGSQPACRWRAVPRGLDAARQPGTSPVPGGRISPTGQGSQQPAGRLLQEPSSCRGRSPGRSPALRVASGRSPARPGVPASLTPHHPTRPGSCPSLRTACQPHAMEREQEGNRSPARAPGARLHA